MHGLMQNNLRDRDDLSTRNRGNIPKCPLLGGSTVAKRLIKRNSVIVIYTAVEFFFSEVDYRQGEDAPFSIVVEKSSSVAFANPVTLQITPMTIEDAFTAGIISIVDPEDPFCPDRASMSLNYIAI